MLTQLQLMQSLEDLSELNDIKCIKKWLKQCGWTRMSMGFTSGGVSISFTLRELKVDQADYMDQGTNAMALALSCHRDQKTLENEFKGTDVLANDRIDYLHEQCGLSIVDIKWKPKYIRVVLCSSKTCNDRLSGFALWRYSPIYLRFFEGFNAENDIMPRIWSDVSRRHYIIDESWKQTLHSILSTYVASGITRPTRSFIPSIALKPLYLWGTAGVGKSTFVQCFAHAMEYAMQSTINPKMQVNIVKIPMNSVTPEHLSCILRVQGISDWSVERLVEQSVVRGHVAILHLEETPEDIEMQLRLYALVKKMLEKLMNEKYPDLRGNVITIITSNYPPHPGMELECMATIKAPDAASQYRWAIEMLHEHVPQLNRVDLQLNCTDDMRPLNNWWRTLSWLCREARPDESVDIRNDRTIAIGSRKVVAINSDDGFFYRERGNDSNLQTVFRMAVDGYLSPGVVCFQQDMNDFVSEINMITSILQNTTGGAHMMVCDVGELNTADDEIKICGDPGEIRGGLFEFIDNVNNPHSSYILQNCEICTRGSCESQSGADLRVAVVIARVSELGQFMLRELLEDGDKTRTHRLSISKRRVIFLLQLLPGSKMTPQLQSRAHFIQL